MASPGPITNLVGRLAYEVSKAQPYVPMYLHLIVSALFPIYAGAHASLSRPSSAASPNKKSRPEGEDGDETEEEVEVVQHMEGLSPSDALMFPLLAGSTLAGLYFLIKWLNDPALLNKILNWYFSAFGVFSISKLVADALKMLHSFLFPKRYVYGGRIWHVNNKDESVSTTDGHGPITQISPLPGLLARMPLPSSLHNFLWQLSTLPSRKLTIKASLYRFGALKLKMGIHDLVGLFSGMIAVFYYNLVSKPWWLTNVLGFGFCYGAIQLMSPTTFWTGTLVESALFFYDIYFVFFTPIMVTVAKSLDVPIKLLFPRPPAPDADRAVQQLAMLGLGDIVLPGIMIGLALRFDLYLFYLRKQKNVVKPTDVGDGPRVIFDSAAGCFRVQNGGDTTSVKDSEQGGLAMGSQHGKDSERPVKAEQQKTEIVKAPYQSVAGGWGERFWTSSWTGRSRISHSEPSTFSKTYFHASLAGYVAGMLATLGVMQVTSHPQPALLYLVPGVLGSLWATALVRGEVKQMWEFSERSEDEVEKKGSGGDNTRRAGGKREKHRQVSRHGPTASSDAHEDETRLGGGESRKGDVFARDGEQEIVFFSVTAPAPRKPRKVGTEENSGQGQRRASDGSTASESGPPSKIDSVEGTTLRRRPSLMSENEPAIKRQRTE